MAPTGFAYVFSNPGLMAYKVGMARRALRRPWWLPLWHWPTFMFSVSSTPARHTKNSHANG